MAGLQLTIESHNCLFKFLSLGCSSLLFTVLLRVIVPSTVTVGWHRMGHTKHRSSHHITQHSDGVKSDCGRALICLVEPNKEWRYIYSTSCSTWTSSCSSELVKIKLMHWMKISTLSSRDSWVNFGIKSSRNSQNHSKETAAPHRVKIDESFAFSAYILVRLARSVCYCVLTSMRVRSSLLI